MSLKPSFRRFGSSSSNKSPPMLPSRSSDATPQLAQPSALDQPGILLAPETWSKTGSGSSSVLLTPTPPLPPSVQSTSTNSGTDLTAQLQNKLAFVDGDKSDRAGASSKMERQPSGSTFVDGTKSPRASAMSSGLPRTWTQSSAGDGRYRRKVGFEAFDTQPEALFAFTCAAKSEGYKRSRNTRVFAIALAADESSDYALDWLMNELVEDGDEIVAIRVIDIDEGERTDPGQQDEFREEAQTLLATILDKNNDADDRSISVIVEMVAGRVTEMLLKMIALYRPDSLVVGTKVNRTRFQKWGMAMGAPGMGSVSRYVVSHSPVPVIVVRPERKVKKHLEKRQNDPKRGQYAALLGPDGGLSLSRSRSRGSIGALSDKSDRE